MQTVQTLHRKNITAIWTTCSSYTGRKLFIWKMENHILDQTPWTDTILVMSLTHTQKQLKSAGLLLHIYIAQWSYYYPVWDTNTCNLKKRSIMFNSLKMAKPRSIKKSDLTPRWEVRSTYESSLEYSNRP